MPTALYTLSYQDTGSIVSFCLLEKQKVDTPAAAATLRDQLVGPTFVLRLGTSTTSAGIQIPSSDLSLDEIDIDAKLIPAFARDPNAKVVLLPDDNSRKPGDGQVKKLAKAEALHKLDLSQADGLVAQTTSARSVKTSLYAFLESGASAAANIPVASDTGKLPLPVTSTQKYAVAFFGRGLATFLGVKTAAP